MRGICVPAEEPFVSQEKTLLDGVMYLCDIYIHIVCVSVCVCV